jgi:hypothetical protein
MRKILPIALLLAFIIPFPGNAQLPGDFNCSGSVNGLDVTNYWYILHTQIFNPIDTSSCFWRNGDMNADGLYSTIADNWQLICMIRGGSQGDHLPHPAYLDSIITEDAWGVPGDTVLMPIIIRTDEDMGAYEINIKYDERYLIRASSEVFINDTTMILFYETSYGFPAGRYLIDSLKFVIAPDTPLDTTLSVSLVGGWYFPTGFANYSYPTHFITPIMINGAVHVGTSGVDEPILPGEFNLQSYPNPFNAQTTIAYDLTFSSNVTLSIFDITGRKIETLFDGSQNAGPHQIIWIANDYSSGVYFYRIQAGNLNQTKRALLLK